MVCSNGFLIGYLYFNASVYAGNAGLDKYL